MTVAGYTIPTSFEDNSFVLSLAKQEETKELSERQVEVLVDIIGIKEDISDLMAVEYVTATTLIENYNYCDYHGDYFMRTKEVGFVTADTNFEEKVQDYNAADHGAEVYKYRYMKGRVIEVPAKLCTEYGYFHIDAFTKAMKKINGGKMRSAKTFNRAVRIARKALGFNHITVDEEHFLNNTRPRHF